MNCVEIHPATVVLIGGGCGFLIYLIFRCGHLRHLPTVHGAIESSLNACGFISGAFLVFSIFCPENFGHLVSRGDIIRLNDLWIKNGDGTFKSTPASFEIGEFISIDAGIGAFALITMCILGLAKVFNDAKTP